MTKRFITHIRTERGSGIPPKDAKKTLFFYTRLSGTPNEWYWGTDNNSFSLRQMEDMVERGTAFVLPEEVELIEKKGLWFDNNGNVFYADLMYPNQDPDKKLLFNSAELLELCK